MDNQSLQEAYTQLWYNATRGKTVTQEQVHILEWAQKRLGYPTKQLILSTIESVVPERREITEEMKWDENFPDRMWVAGWNKAINETHSNIRKVLGGQNDS